MLVYGLWLAALCISAFVLVLFGWGNGNSDIGLMCNETYSEGCEVVFRARATTFASLTWFALFLAWEMVHMRRSFFRMQPGSTKYFTQWFHDVWRNKFLFWAIIMGVVTIFPLLYIPGLSDGAFKHTGITWEWGIVIVESILFFAGIEAWKFAKRVYFRRKAAAGGGEKDDLETRIFGHYFTMGSNDGESSADSDPEKAVARTSSPPRQNGAGEKAAQ